MSLLNFISKLFTTKSKKQNSLPTVKSSVHKYLTKEDILKELSAVKQKYRDVIFSDEHMVRSILVGYNLKISADSLRERNELLSKSEVGDIVNWFSNRCHYIESLHRADELDITEGIWISSGCCGPRGKPVNHDKFNGKKFLLKDGLMYRGKAYFPGGDQYCRCGHKSVLPF